MTQSIEQLKGLLEKATPLLNDCARGYENAADLAAQFQAATELAGGDAGLHEQSRAQNADSAATIRSLIEALSQLESDKARMGKMEEAIKNRLRGDTSEYNSGFDAGIRAALSIIAALTGDAP